MTSPWGDFTIHTLLFEVGGTLVRDPVTKQFVRVDPQTITVKCTLKEARGIGPRERAFMEASGVDLSKFLLEGRYVEPMERPPNLFPGAESPFLLNGVDGVFTLEPTFPGTIPAVTEALGERIFGTWRERTPDEVHTP